MGKFDDMAQYASELGIIIDRYEVYIPSTYTMFSHPFYSVKNGMLVDANGALVWVEGTRKPVHIVVIENLPRPDQVSVVLPMIKKIVESANP